SASLVGYTVPAKKARCCWPFIDNLFSSLEVRTVDRLGFRRAFLSQKNSEYDNRGNRQKFALPVLKRFKPKLRLAQVGGQRFGRLAFELVLKVKVVQAAKKMNIPSNEKEQHKRNR